MGLLELRELTKEYKRGDFTGILLSGIHALLIPHALIGGCAMETMTCRKVAFPAITVISILLLIGAGIYLVLLSKQKSKE
jgi:hypothetical protein